MTLWVATTVWQPITIANHPASIIPDSDPMGGNDCLATHLPADRDGGGGSRWKDLIWIVQGQITMACIHEKLQRN